MSQDEQCPQLTADEARHFGESGKWQSMTHEQRATFQMSQRLLCMPFGVFHESIEKALNRPVYTHEFGLNWQGLRDELAGKAAAPSMQEIIDMLPADKTIVVARGVA